MPLYTGDPFDFAQGRLLTRLNCAGFRDDAPLKQGQIQTDPLPIIR